MQLGIGISNKLIGLLALPQSADWIILFIKPLFILALIYTLILIGNWILSKLKLEKYRWIIGIR